MMFSDVQWLFKDFAIWHKASKPLRKAGGSQMCRMQVMLQLSKTGSSQAWIQYPRSTLYDQGSH